MSDRWYEWHIFDFAILVSPWWFLPLLGLVVGLVSLTIVDLITHNFGRKRKTREWLIIVLAIIFLVGIFFLSGPTEIRRHR